MQRIKEFIHSSKRPPGIKYPHTISSESDPIVTGTYYLVAPRWLLLKLETKDGLVGWGEGTLEDRSEVVARQLESLGEFLVNADSRNINYIVQQLRKQPFYSRNCPVMNSAIAAIDTALWDIKAKRAGIPLCEALGGALHSEIRTYHWFGGNVPQVTTSAEQLGVVDWVKRNMENKDLAQGLFYKMNALPQIGLVDTYGAINHSRKVLQALHREFSGKNVYFGLDCHGRLDVASVFQFLRMLEEFQDIVLFVEEPLPITSLAAYESLRQATFLRIAMGERLYEPSSFTPAIANAWVSIVQPDVAHCLGVTACKQIGDFANEHGVDVSYHCPNGPVSLAASLHIKATLIGECPQECSDGIHYNSGTGPASYLTNPQALTPDKFGYIKLSSAPGLGITMDEKRIEQGCAEPLWDESTCHLYDQRTGAPRAW